MPFKYDPPSVNEFRQGEILANILEYQPIDPKEGDSETPLERIPHPLAVVITQDCDLFSDFRQRSTGNLDDPNILSHLLLCDLFLEAEVRTRLSAGSDIWKRVKQNQDERYHRLPAGPIGDGGLENLPDLYLDFKRILSFPTDRLYQATGSGAAKRLAIVPTFYVQDLIHRLFSFQARVAVPQENE